MCRELCLRDPNLQFKVEAQLNGNFRRVQQVVILEGREDPYSKR